jgi:hypothetical protein
MRASGLTCSTPGAVGSQSKPIARPVATSITKLRQRHIVRAGMPCPSMASISDWALELALNT